MPDRLVIARHCFIALACASALLLEGTSAGASFTFQTVRVPTLQSRRAASDSVPTTEDNAIALADFNGDTQLDVALASCDDNAVAVLLGKGDGSFGDATIVPAGACPASIAVSDFNHDGKPDVAVANFQDPMNQTPRTGTVSVLLGNGRGGFGAARAFTVGPAPLAVVAGDVTGNGIASLAVANLRANTVSVLRGSGTGSFAHAVDLSVGASSFPGPIAVAAGDLNHNGTLDLVVPNRDEDTVSVLLGNGSGAFSPNSDVEVGDFPVALALGDVDADGNLDVLVLNARSRSVSLLLGTGDGGFTRTDIDAGVTPHAVAVDDFDGDGHLDAFVASSDYGPLPLLLGSGDGGFDRRIDFTVSDPPAAMAAGDLDGDHRPDLVVMNAIAGTVGVWLNTLTPPTSSPIPTASITHTARRATATPTPLQPSPTHPPAATHTAMPSACAGDCDGDNSVVITEIITLLNISLGTGSITACRAGDHDHDTMIAIDEIIAAVNSALSGCPTPVPTVTPNATPTPTSPPTATVTATASATTTATATVIPIPTSRFADNGNGTVTDRQTGLVWEKKSDNGDIHDKDEQFSLSTEGLWGPTGTAYTQLLATLNAQAFGGYTDWRVPTILDLVTLQQCFWIDRAFDDRCRPGCDVTTCSCTAPYLGNPASEDGTAGAIHFTSSTLPGDPHHAQVLAFGESGGRGLSRSRSHYVRAVRGAARQRWVDNGNGTITDHLTGLWWEKKSNDGAIHDKSRTYSWSTGAPWGANGTVFTQFLATLNSQPFAGFTDWRLPSADELDTLHRDVTDGPCGAVDLVFSNQCPCDLGGCACHATDTNCSCASDHPEWSSTATDSDVTQALASGTPTRKNAFAGARAVRGGL